MANIVPGPHRIVSQIEGNPPTSISLIKPAWQTVHLNGHETTWRVRREGDKIYRLSLGGYPFTGVVDDEVIASVHLQQNVEWIATYREHQGAYTIEPANNKGYGWTVADPSDKHSPIVIKKIEVYYINEPYGIYLATQLFKVQPPH